ncbi:MAG: hypothetical protein WHU54_04540 [Candidatus Bathyarchaeia archaeon]
MSNKVKKTASSMSFSLSRWFRKISTAQPSSVIISIIVMAYAIFLLGGGIFSLTTQPPYYAYISNNFYFIWSRILQGSSALGEQFVSETIISSALYAMGFVGLLSIYQSTKYAYKPRQAYMMLIIGVTLLLLAYIFLEFAIDIKV